MPQHVFVYGTLRKGEVNHFLLEDSLYLGRCQTDEKFYLYDLGPYPALGVGDQSIQGEVYQVDEATFQRLDQLEDYPIEYDRQVIVTPFGHAWVYIYQDVSKLNRRITSGDWCQKLPK
ncbi:gamma-glutamylcyclotransferase family protein [Vibrio rumoiensis]|uniref:Gamma-glutamylcyclotransferase family protein n=1 Tax=Vibrio rumoiensis 1S-45 TaxID=1188252 RepID=A0A1E5DYW3_9VIBR|nr:gamma-glutamylcyclotransferase [Vibrio rumoiensis]OEF22996.1 gamma-glutamylcyclotransferase [Vibrio rumoiensis 1S-45]